METTVNVPEGPGAPEEVREVLEGLKPLGYVEHSRIAVEHDGCRWWSIVWRRSRLGLVQGPGAVPNGPPFLGAVMGEPVTRPPEGGNVLDRAEWDGFKALPRLAPLEVVGAIAVGSGLEGCAVWAAVPPPLAEGGPWPVLRFQAAPMGPGAGGVQ